MGLVFYIVELSVLKGSIKFRLVSLGSDESGELKLSSGSRVLVLAFLVVSATSSTLYAWAAYRVSRRWACGGSAAWCCMGSIDNATFFPWPRGPLGVCAEVITKMNPVDGFIYLDLIKNGVLLVVSVLLWGVVALYFFRSIKPLFRKAKYLQLAAKCGLGVSDLNEIEILGESIDKVKRKPELPPEFAG